MCASCTNKCGATCPPVLWIKNVLRFQYAAGHVARAAGQTDVSNPSVRPGLESCNELLLSSTAFLTLLCSKRWADETKLRRVAAIRKLATLKKIADESRIHDKLRESSDD